MMAGTLKSRLYPLLAAVLLSGLLFFKPAAQKASDAVMLVLRPLNVVSTAAGNTWRRLGSTRADRNFLMHKNYLLRTENESLKASLAVYQASYAENMRLRAMLDIPLALDEKPLAAVVVARGNEALKDGAEVQIAGQKKSPDGPPAGKPEGTGKEGASR